MPSSYIHVYLNTRFKNWVLLFTVALSLLAFGGNAGNNQPAKKINRTELYTVKPFILKGGISYKRAASALYKVNSTRFIIRQDFARAALIFTRQNIKHYQHLNQTFLITKQALLYPISHQHYMAPDDDTPLIQKG